MQQMTLTKPVRLSATGFGSGLKVGSVVEFREGCNYTLGVIEGQDKRKWIVYDKV